MISSFIVEYLNKQGFEFKLIKGGTEVEMLCPFHKERKPSFGINLETGQYNCFSCKAGGRTFESFVKKISGENIDLNTILTEKDKVMYLLSQAYEKSSQNILSGEHDRNFHELLKLEALNWIPVYQSEDALNYLRETRKFSNETITKFGLKYCYSGRYQNRIIMPMTMDGVKYGFQSRLLGVNKQDGKDLRYLSFLNTRIFKKFILNINAVQNFNHCILVEGYFDLMWMDQNKIQNVISTTTNAVLPEHVPVLNKFKKVIFCYDNDENGKGDEGVEKSVKNMLKYGYPKHFYKAILPYKKDPNETSPEELSEVFKNLKPIRYALDPRNKRV